MELLQLIVTDQLLDSGPRLASRDEPPSDDKDEHRDKHHGGIVERLGGDGHLERQAEDDREERHPKRGDDGGKDGVFPQVPRAGFEVGAAVWGQAHHDGDAVRDHGADRGDRGQGREDNVREQVEETQDDDDEGAHED